MCARKIQCMVMYAKRSQRAAAYTRTSWRSTGCQCKLGNYIRRLMGDSFKLMPLDLLFFSNLIEKVAWLVVSRATLKGNKKYTMMTPTKRGG